MWIFTFLFLEVFLPNGLLWLTLKGDRAEIEKLVDKVIEENPDTVKVLEILVEESSLIAF